MGRVSHVASFAVSQYCMWFLLLGCLLFLICIEFVYLYFPVLFCLSVSVKWLAVKSTSEMTYTVSSGALNSTPTPTLASIKSRLVLPFRYRLTREVLHKGPLNRCVCVCVLYRVNGVFCRYCRLQLLLVWALPLELLSEVFSSVWRRYCRHC